MTGDLRRQFGWEKRVETVASVYRSLDASEREHTVLFAGWYGPAGAIDVFGVDHGLPGAFSSHHTYRLWGRPGGDVRTVIAADVSRELLAQYFSEVTVGAQTTIENADPGERVFSVYVCRHPKVSLAENWPGLRRR